MMTGVTARAIQPLTLARATVAERSAYARLRGHGAPRRRLAVTPTSGLPTRGGATALARHHNGGTINALCKGRRTMACAITSLLLFAMFGMAVAAGMALWPGTKEKPSARRQETPVAPSGDRVTA
jgi:hypothetical protein